MNEARQVILDAGLKPTQARIAVLSSIAKAGTALSHPEIVSALTAYGEFDRVTIYRVLDWLTEHALIHRISGENRAWKFQLTKPVYRQPQTLNGLMGLPYAQHQHAHLHCIQCRKISCIHELTPQFSSELLAKYQVDSIDIHLKGVCTACAGR